MANTADTTKNGNFIQVTYSGTGADWDYSTDGGFKDGMWVKSITFHPSAQDDRLIINEGSVDGASIMDVKCTGATPQDKVKYFQGEFGTYMKPYIDLSDCTFGTIANVKIVFELA